MTYTLLRSVHLFLHSSPLYSIHRNLMLYKGPNTPSKLFLRVAVSVPPSNTWFLGSTRISSPNGISIGSAVFRPHRSITYMYVDVAYCYNIDRVLSVGLSQSWALQKRLNRSRCYFCCGIGWTQGIVYWMGVQVAPCERTIFRGKDMPGIAQRHCAVSCAKMAELIEMPFGLWARRVSL